MACGCKLPSSPEAYLLVPISIPPSSLGHRVAAKINLGGGGDFVCSEEGWDKNVINKINRQPNTSRAGLGFLNIIKTKVKHIVKCLKFQI